MRVLQLASCRKKIEVFFFFLLCQEVALAGVPKGQDKIRIAQSENKKPSTNTANSANAVPPGQISNGARAQFEKISKLTFQIKTAVSIDAAKASYGTGFVVDKSGILATNFHVVETALSHPDQYKIFLVESGKSKPVVVVDFDAINDLALLKIDETYDDIVPIAESFPAVGEKIFSLGVPEDLRESVIEGIYNGRIEEGPYDRLLISSPLNSGMSGGPTVNASGELVGVNVSIYRSSQNISFSVPKSRLVALIERYKANPVDLSKPGFLNVTKKMNTQVHFAADKLMEGYLKFANSSTLELDGWVTKGMDPGVKCWRSVDKPNQEIWKVSQQACRVQGTTQLHDDNYGGRYSVNYNTYRKAPNVSNMKFFYWLNNSTENYNKNNTWADDYYTKYSCFKQTMKNQHEVTLTAKVCVCRYIRFDDVYDGFFQVTTPEVKDNVLVIRGSAIGFRMEQFHQFLQTELQGVKSTHVSQHQDGQQNTH